MNLMSIKEHCNSLAISSDRFNTLPKEKITISEFSSLRVLALPILIESKLVSISAPGPSPLGYLTAAGPEYS